MQKSKLRNRILKLRQSVNQNNIKIKFNEVLKIIKKDNLNKTAVIGGYFPVNFEVDDLDILKEFYKKKYITCLPVIKNNHRMDFYKWNLNDPLRINKYGIPEPFCSHLIYPDIILVPLVAFDKNLNRLGYGGGYYDRLIQKLSKKKKILKIGLAFSLQKLEKIPTTKHDKKLDYVITEKYTL